MHETNADSRSDGALDRRFLLRGAPGRRVRDREATEFLPEDVDGTESRATPGSYLFLLFAMMIIGAVTVRSLNAYLAPLLYSDRVVMDVGRSLNTGQSYLTYDLNIETRGLRRESIRTLKSRPELAVMGASHWQEAHGAIIPGVDFYNAHVHRDYFEDIVAVASWFYRYDRMPEKLVISIRDSQFMPVEARTDYLWVPILPEYREAAPIFGLEPHHAYANGLTPRLEQAVSLPVLWANFVRFLNAPELPRPAQAVTHATLDVLLPDGAIYWSERHRRAFTAERARSEAEALADAKIASPPIVDAEGVEAVDRVVAFMVDHGVEVYLAHPPFNPITWDRVQGTPYIGALSYVEKIVQTMADKYGIRVIGSFNPYDVGCTAEMYIDGEHSNPLCLGEILAQVYQNDLVLSATTLGEVTK